MTCSLHGVILDRPFCRYGVADGWEDECSVNFLFFTACSILQILVPATVTVQAAGWTIPVTLRVTQRPELDTCQMLCTTSSR